MNNIYLKESEIKESLKRSFHNVGIEKTEDDIKNRLTGKQKEMWLYYYNDIIRYGG